MPLAPGLGYKSILLVGKETVIGTPPATANMRSELTGFNWNGNLSVIEDPSMTATTMSRRFIGQGGQFVTGTIRTRLNYEGHEWIWKMLLPSCVKTGASAPWQYVFKELGSLVSFTIDVLYGDMPAGTYLRFTGAYVTGFRLSGSAGGGEGGMLTAEIDFVAQAATTTASPMTGGTLPSPLGVIYHQLITTATNLVDGSGASSPDIFLRSFNLSFTIPHDPERYYFGSVNAAPPVRNGPMDATFEFEEEWNATSLMTQIRAGTYSNLKLNWSYGAGASLKQLMLVASSPTANLYTSEIAGFGAIIQRAGYRLAYNTTDASLIVVTTQGAVNDTGVAGTP